MTHIYINDTYSVCLEHGSFILLPSRKISKIDENRYNQPGAQLLLIFKNKILRLTYVAVTCQDSTCFTTQKFRKKMIMDEKYMKIYKTFIIDIVTSTSFPLFVIYLISATNCYKWKKIAGPLNFPKVLYIVVR